MTETTRAASLRALAIHCEGLEDALNEIDDIALMMLAFGHAPDDALLGRAAAAFRFLGDNLHERYETICDALFGEDDDEGASA